VRHMSTNQNMNKQAGGGRRTADGGRRTADSIKKESWQLEHAGIKIDEFRARLLVDSGF
jgi:hypothetical protein